MKNKLVVLMVLLSLSVVLVSGCGRVAGVGAAAPFPGQVGWSASAPEVPGLNEGYPKLTAAPAAENAWPAVAPEVPGYNAPYPQ